MPEAPDEAAILARAIPSTGELMPVVSCGMWQTFDVTGFLPVQVSSIAADLRTPLPTVFLGTTVFHATMGLVAPIIGKAFKGLGAKIVMLIGIPLIGGGLAVLSVSGTTLAYLQSWAVAGVGRAMFLATAACIPRRSLRYWRLAPSLRQPSGRDCGCS